MRMVTHWIEGVPILPKHGCVIHQRGVNLSQAEMGVLSSDFIGIPMVREAVEHDLDHLGLRAGQNCDAVRREFDVGVCDGVLIVGIPSQTNDPVHATSDSPLILLRPASNALYFPSDHRAPRRCQRTMSDIAQKFWGFYAEAMSRFNNPVNLKRPGCDGLAGQLPVRGQGGRGL
jgi:hypothetical protein